VTWAGHRYGVRLRIARTAPCDARPAPNLRSPAMRVRQIAAGGVCVVAVLALAGCATSGFDEAHTQAQLERSGLTPTQAQCVTNGLTDKYALQQLASHSAPTQQEYDFTRSLLLRCKVTVPLVPPP